MVQTIVVDGDITQVTADALLTSINAGGLWNGSVDQAILRSSDGMFHDQALAVMPMRDGQVIIANATAPHKGMFDNVVFVVDELEQPISSLVLAVLEAAEAQEFTSVSIPTFRTGLMVDVRETRVEALRGLVNAIAQFIDEEPRHVQLITVVVYNNEVDQQYLDYSLLGLKMLKESMPYM